VNGFLCNWKNLHSILVQVFKFTLFRQPSTIPEAKLTPNETQTKRRYSDTTASIKMDLPYCIQLFHCLWQEDDIRDTLFRCLSNSDIGNVRLASPALCNLITKRLFRRMQVTFTASTFTKPSRVQALARIGHHIEHLTFHFPHSEATFLPPLIHPETGAEINFLYTPHTSMSSVLTRPKYANTELGEILTQQYPPLFHAATNVPSFINALKNLPNMRALTIKCPGQNPQERYRRDVVDYALISLRIAVERAPVDRLSKLTLHSLHPSAFNYLRHHPGFGSVPSAARRWKQIKKLYISVESWDFYSHTPGLDHLKIIDDYIRNFSPQLEKFTFTWLGRFKGPCPLSLSQDPLFAPPRHSQKLFNEATSPMSPLPSPPCRPPIHLPRLKYMQVRNATMTGSALSDLVEKHRATVKEFDFERVALMNGGSMEDVFAPLLDDRSNASEVWSRNSRHSGSEAGSVQTSSSGGFDADYELPSPSAAVAAAARELLGSEFGISFDDFDDDEAAPEEQDIDDLASDVAAAREASRSFSTKLTKQKIHRHKRRKHGDGKREREREAEKEKDKKRGRSKSRHRHHHHSHEHNGSTSKQGGHRHHHHKHSRSVDDIRDPTFRPETPRPLPKISAPIPNMDPPPVLLQPAVYDPHAPRKPDEGISTVQRNLEKEEAHRLLAEDAAARMSALRKAKEAVLSKLSKEYCSKSSSGGRKAGHGPPAVLEPQCSAAAAATFAMGARFREGLFGKSSVSVLSDARGLESQSALVPLMFSRS
jgi:hypothetical protein